MNLNVLHTQVGVAVSKNVVSDNIHASGCVIRRIASFAIKQAHCNILVVIHRISMNFDILVRIFIPIVAS